MLVGRRVHQMSRMKLSNGSHSILEDEHQVVAFKRIVWPEDGDGGAEPILVFVAVRGGVRQIAQSDIAQIR